MLYMYVDVYLLNNDTWDLDLASSYVQCCLQLS